MPAYLVAAVSPRQPQTASSPPHQKVRYFDVESENHLYFVPSGYFFYPFGFLRF